MNIFSSPEKGSSKDVFLLAGAMVGLRYYDGGFPPAAEDAQNHSPGRGSPGGNSTVDSFGLRLYHLPGAVGDQIGNPETCSSKHAEFGAGLANRLSALQACQTAAFEHLEKYWICAGDLMTGAGTWLSLRHRAQSQGILQMLSIS